MIDRVVQVTLVSQIASDTTIRPKVKGIHSITSDTTPTETASEQIPALVTSLRRSVTTIGSLLQKKDVAFGDVLMKAQGTPR